MKTIELQLKPICDEITLVELVDPSTGWLTTEQFTDLISGLEKSWRNSRQAVFQIDGYSHAQLQTDLRKDLITSLDDEEIIKHLRAEVINSYEKVLRLNDYRQIRHFRNMLSIIDELQIEVNAF